MSRWFRHYAGMMRDDKLVRVAIRTKQPVERIVWLWGAILESAAEIDDDGRYDIDPAEIAYFLRADQTDIDAAIAGLEDAGRIAAGAVVKWGDRQFKSDRSAARVAAHRERKRSKNLGDKDSAASQNGDVTLPKRHGIAPETETETEDLEPDGSRASGDAPEVANDDENPLRPEHVVAKWNELAPSMGKPTVRDLTPERRALLRARIGQYSVDDFITVFGNIRGSPFLRGDTGKHFCTFDWAMKKANFQKILEGNYAHG